MEKDVLAAADHLRNQLGIFYWTIQRSGDLEIAAQQLQTVVCLTERETSPWCLSTPPTVFARWSHLQLLLLLAEARQVLHRLGQRLSPSETIVRETLPYGEASEVIWYGPLT